MTNSNYSRKTTTCDCSVIHPKAVDKAVHEMANLENLFELAEFYRMFGDSTRIRILWALRASELCVCDLCTTLDMTQSAISHQLRVLKQARLVRYRREGKIVFYSLCDKHIALILNVGMEHTQE